MSPEKRGIGSQNLAGAFGKRVEGLDRLPRMSTPEPEASEEPGKASKPTAKTRARTGPKKTETRGRSTPKARPSPPASAATGTSANRAVYVDIKLRDRLREHINKHPGTNYTTTVFDAIEQNLDTLTAGQEPAPTSSSLFERTPRGRRQDGVDRIQLTLRLTQRNEDILDSLVEETGAQNRSDLVSRALRAFFN